MVKGVLVGRSWMNGKGSTSVKELDAWQREYYWEGVGCTDTIIQGIEMELCSYISTPSLETLI